MIFGAGGGGIDPTQVYVGGGAVLVLAGILVGLVWRVWKLFDKQNSALLNPAYAEIMKLRDEHSECQRKLDILVDVLRQNGIQVPSSVWEKK